MQGAVLCYMASLLHCVCVCVCVCAFSPFQINSNLFWSFSIKQHNCIWFLKTYLLTNHLMKIKQMVLKSFTDLVIRGVDPGGGGGGQSPPNEHIGGANIVLPPQ